MIGSRGQGAQPVRFIAGTLAAGALLVAHRAAFLYVPGSASGTPLLDRWLYDPSMAPPALAAAVFALLVVHRRARIAAALRAGEGSFWGIGVLLAGAALLLWARQIEADHLVMLALGAHVAGIAGWVGGAPLLGAVAAPLAALMLAVPVPPQILHEVVFPMQLWTASSASFLLDVIGRSHELTGDLIHYGGDVFHVVEGCCGFKSTVSLVLAAIVYGDFVLERPAARAALAFAALPIGVASNAVRVTLLVTGRIVTESPAHDAYGVLSIAGGVAVLALGEVAFSLAFARWRRSRARAVRSEIADAPPRAQLSSHGPGIQARASMAIAFVMIEGLVTEVLPAASWPSVQSGINIETLPNAIGGRTASVIRGDDSFLGSVWFAHRIHRSYAADDDSSRPVRLFIGLEDVAAADRSGISPKTAVPASGWHRIERVPEERRAQREHGSQVEWSQWIVTYADRRTHVLHGRLGYAPWGLELVDRWFGLDRFGGMGMRRSPIVIRLEVDERAGEAERSGMMLRQVGEGVEQWYERATK